MAIDYPFSGYHELTTCYAVSGWHVRSEAADPAAGVTRVTLDRTGGDGYLLFAQLDEAGRPVVAAPPVDTATTWGGLRFKLAYARQMAVAGASYQVQSLLQTGAPPTAEQRRATEDLYRAARAELTAQLLAQVGGGA